VPGGDVSGLSAIIYGRAPLNRDVRMSIDVSRWFLILGVLLATFMAILGQKRYFIT
jgi:hypothetical protein